MYERYGCDATQQLNRTFTYFEYPAIVVMMLRDYRYGISVGLNDVVVWPSRQFLDDPNAFFEFQSANLHVSWSHENIVLAAPDVNGKRTVMLYGVIPSSEYSIVTSSTDCAQPSVSDVKSDNYGMIKFVAILTPSCGVAVSLKASTRSHANALQYRD
jgi:hypothetical protein